jgi:hypothetical protein
MINNLLASKVRFGIIGGYGDLVIFDADRKGKHFESIVVAIESLPQTLTIQTINGGRHYYFFCKGIDNGKFKDESGEIRAKNMMVVAPNSKLCGKKYEVMKDMPIAEVKPELVKVVLQDYIIPKQVEANGVIAKWTSIYSILQNKKDFKLQALLEGKWEGIYDSRSEAEQALMNKLVFYDLNKEQCFQAMEIAKIGKWKEAPLGYKELTYQKADNWKPKEKEVEIKPLEKITPKEEKKEETKLDTDVPTLELVDFSEYKKLFANTHNHLPAFDLIDNELGLNGQEYYAMKKCLNYYVESLKQKTVRFCVGSEFFDNRLHLLCVGASGTGKGKVKAITRKHSSVVECSGNRTNLEQLIGKKKKEKGEIVELKGYFGFKGLLVDESQNLIAEKDDNQSAIMREIRIAMDVYGNNKTDKKLVDTELLSYCPETRFCLFSHDILFPPIFFDTGTFRRLFCFELKFCKIKPEDLIRNLFIQSKDKELYEYVNQEDLFRPEMLTFSKEGIDEIIEFFLFWNRFIFLNPSQRVRAVSKGLVYAAKLYFFRTAAILAVMNCEQIVRQNTVRVACLDTIQFLLETIENYANKSNPTLSRDVWKSDDLVECMFLEWMHYNGALTKEGSKISIKAAQDKIQDYFGVQERQARAKYYRLVKAGLIKDYKGAHHSICWLGFNPMSDCPIDYENDAFPNLAAFITKKLAESG